MNIRGFLRSLGSKLRRLFSSTPPALPAATSVEPEPPPASAALSPEAAYARVAEAWCEAQAAEMRPRWFWQRAGRVLEMPAPPALRARVTLLSNGSGQSSARTLYDEPSVRQFALWDPIQVRSALMAAEAGTLMRAADLCEAILGDDRALAVLNTRANALLGCELKFEMGFGKKRRAALKALEAEEDFWTAFPEEELRRLLIWGVLLGVGLGEIRWEAKDKADPNSRMIPKLKVWHPRHLRYDWMTHQWFVRVNEYGAEELIQPDGGKWILFTPFGEGRPWAYGLWRGMSLLWLFKFYAFQDWARHSEVHGQPIRMGFLPPEAGKLDPLVISRLRADLSNDLANLGTETVFVPPPGFDFKLVEATARTWQMFLAQIDLANASMSVMAIGGDLATQSKSGTHTGATAQTLVRDDYKASDANALSTCLHDHALVYWADWNFGDRGLAPWPDWQVDPPADLKAKVEVLTGFANALKILVDPAVTAACASQGIEVDIAELFKQSEVPVRAIEDKGGVGKKPKALPELKPEHFQYQLVTKNEARDRLGFGPVAGGNAYPMPVSAQPASPANDGPTPGQAMQQQVMSLSAGITSLLTARMPTRLYRGITATIDRPEGTVQRGTSPDGTPWERTYKVDYGFLGDDPGTKRRGARTTDGGDRMALDCYCGPNPSAPMAYWIVQLDELGGFDEYKVMLGFDSEEDALRCYAAHTPGRYFGGTFSIPMEAMRALFGLAPRMFRAELLSIHQLSGVTHGVAELTRLVQRTEALDDAA